MKTKIIASLCMAALTVMMTAGCSSADKQSAAETVAEAAVSAKETATMQEETVSESEIEGIPQAKAAAVLEDGIYTADFDTDSGMFHINETCDGKGTLTVKDGVMVIHITLTSKNIVNLYPGLAEDAQKDDAEIIQPTTDSVTYSDGITEEVYGFDVPVPVLDEEFDLALIGKKGIWYDHKVSVSNPEKLK